MGSLKLESKIKGMERVIGLQGQVYDVDYTFVVLHPDDGKIHMCKITVCIKQLFVNAVFLNISSGHPVFLDGSNIYLSLTDNKLLSGLQKFVDRYYPCSLTTDSIIFSLPADVCDCVCPVSWCLLIIAYRCSVQEQFA